MDESAERRALTGLRGAAALYVALYHIFRAVYGDAPPPGAHVLGALVLRGYFAVDLFFVLSGFVMAMAYGGWFAGGVSARDYLAFVARRAARLWPLHAAVLCAILAAHALSGTWRVWPRMVAANALLVQAWGFNMSLNVPSWSVSTEVAAYLLFPLLSAVALRGGPALRLAALLAVAGALAAAVQLAPQDGAERHGQLDIYANYSALPLLRCLAGFTVGLLTYRTAGAWAPRPWCATVALAALPVGLAAGLDDLALYPLLPLLVAALASLRDGAAGPLGAAGLLATPPLHWLGRVSYALYLVHVPVLDAARAAAGPGWPALRAGWPGAALAGLLALSLGVAWLAHHAVELPGRRGLQSLASWAGLGRVRVAGA